MGVNVLSLFSCIGGGDIASHLLGFTTIAGVEKEKAFRKTLSQRFPSMELHSDVKTFCGAPYHGQVLILTGGFPCVNISQISKQEGFAKDSGTASSLAWEMVRIIGEVQPKYIFAENVENFASKKFKVQREELFDALVGLGYGGRWTIIGAQHVGAVQRRNRVWLLLEKQENPKIERSKFVFKNLKGENFWPTPRSSGIGAYTFKRKDGKIRDHIVDKILQNHLREIGWADEDIFNPEKVKEYRVTNNIHVNARWLEAHQGLPIGWLDPSCKKPRVHIGSNGEQLFPAGIGEPQKSWEPARICNEKLSPKIVKAIGNIQVPAQAKYAFEILSVEMGINLDKIGESHITDETK